jgi:uncharacterized protein (TIGR00288 family)
MSERKPRIALLIDADNSSASSSDLILTKLATLGEANIRRAYGNWTKSELKSWTSVLHENAIRPMQQFDHSRGKNATDMALVVDAMALLYTDRPDAFAIVSSDADFTPLVMHLRERGAAVYGFGDEKSPQAFQRSCSDFTVLKRPEKKAAESKPKNEVNDLLLKAVQEKADKSGWARVQAVRQGVGDKSSFDPRTYGSATLSKLLINSGLFEVRNEGTPAIAFRVKGSAKNGRA